jgi:NAD(P)-dependent dehydrogenase (short-subunit alcohol dehydrogenase family)
VSPVPISGPVAIVTGGSRGIGLHVARALGAAGHRVVLVGRDAARLEAARAELAALGAAAATVAVDLRQPGSADPVLAAARASFGEPDVLVNNAGTAPTARLQATTDAMLQETLALHVQAPLALARAALPAMLQRGSGCIVQLASTAGLRAFPFTAAYTAAKHAMVGLTRAMAVELRTTGVRAYAVCPGFVDTEITRQAAAAVAARGRTTAAEAMQRMAEQNVIGRMHTPAEVAAAVAWLATERPPGCVYDLDHDPPVFRD